MSEEVVTCSDLDQERDKRYQEFSDRKELVTQKQIKEDANFQNLIKEIDIQKRTESEKTKRLLCKERDCAISSKNYRGMKRHYSVKHKSSIIPEEKYFISN